MPPLASQLRNHLERVVIDAREAAEAGARAVLETLAVHHHEPYPHMKPEHRELRSQLRARARQLRDRQESSGRLAIDRLASECAYEHWHRMLFARFLAENGLLIEPNENMAISLAEAEELAKEDGVDVWLFASRCAQKMLPQIFRPDDPLLQVSLAAEHMVKLEKLLASLPPAVFSASDALGWVYQFWQSKRKDEVNRSEVKIGADEIPAVTQLFTEPYMVEFLLHNTIGAWWAGKVAAASSPWSSCQSEADSRGLCRLPGLEWDYLRLIKKEKERSDTTSAIGFYRKDDPVENLSGNLQHWRQGAVTYFVTFRTADSLPQDKLKQWQSEREQWLVQHPKPHNEDAKREYYERFPERLEHWLDQGYGACHLKEPALRQIVEDALRHFDGERYNLDEFVVSANHTHALVTPRDEHELSDVLHSWKSFTAIQINRRIGQSGAFWQKESFDHIVRGPAQLERIREYIRGHSDRDKRQDAASTYRPAAGSFDGWPKAAAELKILDPCCGSGHFLVAALHHLVSIRMVEEGLAATEAVDAVLRDNLHGLEIDERCCQITAFALAFAAWIYPGAGGYRKLPDLNIAHTGIAVGGTRDQWLRILEGHGNLELRFFFGQLYDLFRKAPTIGSLINPHRFLGSGMLSKKGMETLLRHLQTAIAEDPNASPEKHEMGIAAQGLAKAAELLADRYTLIMTNVPYLGRGKQDDTLKEHLETQYPLGKADLATAFVLRCLEFCTKDGSIALVTPQNWLFLTTYTKLRETLLYHRAWNIVARLGPGAFETITGHVVNVTLLALSASTPDDAHVMIGIDVSGAKRPDEKAALLRGDQYAEIALVSQAEQLKNPDARLAFDADTGLPRLDSYAAASQGIPTSDGPLFLRSFWEMQQTTSAWEFQQRSVDHNVPYGGRDGLLLYESGEGRLRRLSAEQDRDRRRDLQGANAWGKLGVAVTLMSELNCCLYTGEKFDNNVSAVVPKNQTQVAALWCYLSSSEFRSDVRRIDQKLNVTNATICKVPFDLSHWQKIAAEKYPHGLPEPESDDPTQWLFHGRPAESTAPLQVAVARLLGYRWPAELDGKMRLSQCARALVKRCDELAKFADEDGIVCIQSVRGEEPAAERLLALLDAADVKPAKVRELTGGADLDDWLRNGFFEEHCRLFQDRPFVWHIWDGRKHDGFGALVNYHKLCEGSGKGRKLLESLTYSYLGEWISRQKDGVKRGEGGAEDRLAAALELQKRLEVILGGEPPFDIFVRWKPLTEQPIGWEADINDGVRMNIRPFLASDLPGGRGGAGVLRWKPNIKWTKDRGKEPKRPIREFPWFWGWDGSVNYTGGPLSEFTGERVNDCHYTNEFKRQARQKPKSYE